MPLNKSVLHRSFLNKPTSLPGFCWNVWLHPWVTHLVSLKSKGYPALPLAFHQSMVSQGECPTCSTLWNLDRPRLSQIKCWFLIAKSSFFNPFPSFHISYKQQRRTRLHPPHFAWNTPLPNIQVHCLEVLLSVSSKSENQTATYINRVKIGWEEISAQSKRSIKFVCQAPSTYPSTRSVSGILIGKFHQLYKDKSSQRLQNTSPLKHLCLLNMAD